MPKIRVQFFATLEDIFKKHEQIIECETPISLYHLCERIKDPNGYSLKDYLYSPNGFDLKEDYIILIDGKNVHSMGGASTAIESDCEISIFPKIGGG